MLLQLEGQQVVIYSLAGSVLHNCKALDVIGVQQVDTYAL